MSKLHYAAKSFNLLDIKKALRSEHVNDRDNYQQTALHMSCGLFPSNEIVKFLLSKKADVNVQDRNGWTPLHCAANESQWEICDMLMHVENIDVGVLNRDGTSVLHYLARNSPKDSAHLDLYTNLFDLYVQKRGDINSQSRHGEAAIHQACLKGNITAVKLLIKHGVSINILNKVGETAIHYAIMGGSPNAKEIIELLLKNGADPSIKPENISILEKAPPEIKDLLKKYDPHTHNNSNNNNNNNSKSKASPTVEEEKNEEVQIHDLNEFKIKVKVVRAQSLTPAGEKDDANPYCQIMFSKHKHFTTILKSNLNPKWDEVFFLDVDDISFPIKISIFDSDAAITPNPAKDDLLGSITLSLTDMEIDMSGKAIPLKSWYILKRKPKRPTYKATPKVRVEVAYELKKNLEAMNNISNNNNNNNEVNAASPSLSSSSFAAAAAPNSLKLSNNATNQLNGQQTLSNSGNIFGFKRGKCKAEDCDCEVYQPENERGGHCQNCGHWPAQHTNLGKDDVENSSSAENSPRVSSHSPPPPGGQNGDEPSSTSEKPAETVNDLQARFASTTGTIISHTWEIDATELKFTKRLGEGTSAKVFRGTYRGQDVAIKVLKDKAEAKVLEEFKKEFEIMSTLRSPHVVFFYGACIQPSLCMVLEFCVKGSLYDVLNDANEEVTWSRVFKAAQDTVRGLICLHYWKPVIVHRDMKSLNLLVDENWNVKVSDFGTSRFTGGEHNLSTLGKMRGTYAYCAPEVYFGQSFTPKSDIFSFGVILWELAHRCIKGAYEQPYSEFKQIVFDFQIIIQSAKKDMRPSIPEHCPPNYTNLINKCWDKDPMLRPETLQLQEMLAELQKEYNSNKSAWDHIANPLMKKTN